MTQRPELAAPPGFRPLRPGEVLDDAPATPEDPPPQTSPPPSRAEPPSEPRSPPPTEPPPSASEKTSSRASTDEATPDVAGELGGFFASIAKLASMLGNRATRAKRKVETDLWLMTDDEAFAIGAPFGRIAARRAPAELVEGDGPDLMAAGAATLGYAAHNLAGMSAADVERQEARSKTVIDASSEVRRPAAEPSAPSPAPSPPAPAPVIVTDDAEAPGRIAHIEGVAPPAPSGVPDFL